MRIYKTKITIILHINLLQGGLTTITITYLLYLQRCKQTSVNQETGVEDKTGPIDILRKYRAHRGPTHANFGQHLIPLQKSGKVHVGDTIQIIERKRELLRS